jgi:hypothetical protein
MNVQIDVLPAKCGLDTAYEADTGRVRFRIFRPLDLDEAFADPDNYRKVYSEWSGWFTPQPGESIVLHWEAFAWP